MFCDSAPTGPKDERATKDIGEKAFQTVFHNYYEVRHTTKEPGWAIKYLTDSNLESARKIRFRYLKEALTKLREQTKGCPQAGDTLTDLASQIDDLEVFTTGRPHRHLPEGKGEEFDVHSEQ